MKVHQLTAPIDCTQQITNSNNDLLNQLIGKNCTYIENEIKIQLNSSSNSLQQTTTTNIYTKKTL